MRQTLKDQVSANNKCNQSVEKRYGDGVNDVETTGQCGTQTPFIKKQKRHALCLYPQVDIIIDTQSVARVCKNMRQEAKGHNLQVLPLLTK